MDNSTRHVVLTAVLAPLALFSLAAAAAVTLDGTLGQSGPVAGPNYLIPDSVGQTRGGNLFHSFGQFGLTSSESATFTGPTGIRNILARVTGGEVSSIDGVLRSEILGASLYLLNPTGIMFGPNARLDVSGSFHASTADYLRLADGGRFDARNPAASNLTIAAPAAFGFLGNAPAPIGVDRAALSVPAGRELSLIGGDISIAGSGGSTLLAPSGRINVASVASAGEVVVTPSNVETGSFAQLGTINLTSMAFLDARGDPGGTIFIRGGRFVADNSGSDFTQTTAHTVLSAASTGASDHPGTAIDVQVRGDFRLHGAEVTASSFGTGKGGNIRIEADTIELFGAPPNATDPFGRTSFIASRVFSSGDSGDIALVGREIIVRDGAAIQTQVAFNSGGTGNAGDIDISAQRLLVSGTTGIAFVSSGTFALGNAGNLRVNADEIVMRGGPGGFTGLTTQVAQSSNGNASAGTLSVNARRIDLLDGAQINAGIFSGSGSAGAVRVAADEINISGRDAGGFSAGIFSNVNGVPTTGKGGNIEIVARDLRLTNGGQIASSALLTQGAAGNISITAENVSVEGSSLITSLSLGTKNAGNVDISTGTLRLTGPSQPNVLFGVTSLAGINGGNAGDIRIAARDVQVLDGAVIDSSTTGPGRGGTVDVRADSVLVAGRSGEVPSSISATTFVFQNFVSRATGHGGSVSVEADHLTLRDGGTLTVASRTAGSGGVLRVRAGEISLSSGASVSATASSTGNAGNVEINADSLRVRDAAITTRSDQADGGNISITARSLVQLHNSAITASVGGGAGNGGNIAIDPDFVVLNHSRVSADAVGGNGGNVSIVAGQFVASLDSSVTASSAFGLQGEVVIRAPGENLQKHADRLPEAALDTSALFKSGCAAGNFSRFSASTPIIGATASAGLPSDYSRIDLTASAGQSDAARGPRREPEYVWLASRTQPCAPL